MTTKNLNTINGPIPIMTKTVRYDFINLDAPLDERQRKYCRCLLKVQNKSGNKVNPYAVCSSRLPQVRKCSQYYDWAVMDLDMLVAYADLHKIQIPKNPTRETMFNVINNWKISKGY